MKTLSALSLIAILVVACSSPTPTSSPQISAQPSQVAESAVATESAAATPTVAPTVISLTWSGEPGVRGADSHLSDPAGRTLYYFTFDPSGPNFASQCDNKTGCPGWTPYFVPAEAVLAAGFLVNDKACLPSKFKLSDGRYQAACQLPLYYYDGDRAPGDMNGRDLDPFILAWAYYR